MSFGAIRVRFSKIVLAFLGLLLAAPVGAQPTLVGIWFSAFQPDEPGVMSLIEFRTDGTFYEEFRKCEAGKVAGYQFETGSWTVMDGIEHTTTDTINGDTAKVDNTYTVEILTDTERRIRAENGKDVFVSHRVAEFEFPDCASGA